jgi:putative hydrolase of the HAD superfamily
MGDVPGMSVIMFDAGNTLVWMDHPFLMHLLREFDHQVNEDELLAAEYAAKRVIGEMVRTGQGNDTSRGPIYFRTMLREVSFDESLLPALAPRLIARHAERNLWCRVRLGTVEALRELRGRGYRLGVISNSDGRVEALLESVGLAGYFDFIIDSHVVGLEKPDPRIFQLGCERAGATPEQAIYVGDIYEIDVLGARAAGLHAYLIDPLDRWTNLDCDRIKGIHELPARLAAANSRGPGLKPLH